MSDKSIRAATISKFSGFWVLICDSSQKISSICPWSALDCAKRKKGVKPRINYLKWFISLLILFIIRWCVYCLPCWKEFMRFRWTLFITDSIYMSHESFVYFWFCPINFKKNKRYPFQHPSNKAYFTDICIDLFIYDTQHFHRSNSLSLSHWLNVSLTGSLIIKRKIRYSFLICA